MNRYGVYELKLDKNKVVLTNMSIDIYVANKVVENLISIQVNEKK